MKPISKFTIGALLFMNIGLASAQPERNPQQKRDHIEAQKIAFITRELNLTPEEAQRFWPVYNQCENEQKEMREKYRGKFHKQEEGTGPRTPLDEMNDKEVEEMVDHEMAMRQQELDFQRACLESYKKVLPIKKVAKLYQSERKFKKELLERIREHDGQRDMHR